MQPILKASKRARRLYAVGAQALALWGAQVHGVATTRLEGMRAEAVKACGLSAAGACATVAIKQCPGPEKDPLIKTRCQLVVFWAKNMIGDPSLMQQVASVWAKTRHRLACPALPRTCGKGSRAQLRP